MLRTGLHVRLLHVHRWTAAGVLAIAAVLSACSVGNGNTLKTLSISTAPITTYKCFNSQLSVIGTFDSGGQENDTERAVWTSSNPSIVRVSNGDEITPANLKLGKGIVSPVALGGPVIITATFVGLSASVAVTVLPGKLEITPVVGQLAQGTQLQLYATGILGNPGSQTILNANSVVLWDVFDVNNNVPASKIATISATGLLKAGINEQGAGATIPIKVRATTDIAGCEDSTPGTVSASVNIRNETLQSLGLGTSTTPPPITTITLPVAVSLPILVTGNFSNGYTQDMTNLVTFSSDNVTAGVFGLANEKNVVTTSVASQTANLKATFDQGLNLGPVIGTAALTVNAETLNAGSLTIAPVNGRMIPGTTLDYTAAGMFSDGITYDLTRDLIWTTTPVDTTLVTISNSAGSKGVASSPVTSNSLVTINATRSGFNLDSSGIAQPITTPLTIGAALASLTVSKTVGLAPCDSATSVPVGDTCPLDALANLQDDGLPDTLDTQDLTNNVIWSSDNNAVAAVSNTPGFVGQVTGVSAGTTVVHASFGTTTADFTITVN